MLGQCLPAPAILFALALIQPVDQQDENGIPSLV
jgi:hypothetical protein